MARATKADIASVKHVITAETLTRRPMRSNGTEQVRQCATLIGTADATSLAELIRDPTGMRRFVALPVVKEPDWAALDGIDWVEVWRCIEAEEADPMLPHRGALQEMQESIRDRSPVECWADNIDPKRWLDGALSCGSRFSAKRLYMDFREYEDVFFEGPLKTSIKAWGMEMAAAIADGRVPFEKVKTNKCSTYIWTGPTPDTKGTVRDLSPKKVAGSLGSD